MFLVNINLYICFTSIPISPLKPGNPGDPGLPGGTSKPGDPCNKIKSRIT